MKIKDGSLKRLIDKPLLGLEKIKRICSTRNESRIII